MNKYVSIRWIKMNNTKIDEYDYCNIFFPRHCLSRKDEYGNKGVNKWTNK